VSSGGTFPVSIAERGALVYVLNALGGGSVQGFVSIFGHLFPLPGSNRALGLDPNASPQFVNTPGQVAFSPDGRQLLVTTKANGNDIDVFSVGPFGGLSATPVVNSEPGTVPFAISFGPSGTLAIAEAGTNAVATFGLAAGGSLTQISSVATGQSATCWLTADRGVFFADNAGSGSVSEVAATAAGDLSLVGTAATDPGSVDSALSPDSAHLYVQTGESGVVDEFQVGSGGALTKIGSVTVPGAIGGEGIVAL
jgi:hypothetical protein